MNKKYNLFNKENRKWLEIMYLTDNRDGGTEVLTKHTLVRDKALVVESGDLERTLDYFNDNVIEVYIEDIVVEVLDFEYDTDIEVDFKAPQFFTAYKGNIKDIELLKMQFEEEIELDYNDYLEIRVLEMEYEVYE